MDSVVIIVLFKNKTERKLDSIRNQRTKKQGNKGTAKTFEVDYALADM